MSSRLKLVYLGNFLPAFSTESHVAASLESLGHEVIRLQEGMPASEVATTTLAQAPHLFLHTQTYGYAVTSGTVEERAVARDRIKDVGIPTVFFHLDRWAGLEREDQLLTEPWTKYDYVFTADGDPVHQEFFASLGMNHYWSPPGVFHEEAQDGIARQEWQCDIAFVGSWRQYGHPAWAPQRMEMLNVLRKKYGRRFRTFPMKKAIRGTDLNDLYASVKVVVGDSCLAPAKDGTPIERYWSDRIPETTGRGAVLVHPNVEGLFLVHPSVVAMSFKQGDWPDMFAKIDTLLAHDSLWASVREGQVSETREHNTYRDRLRVVLDTVLGTHLNEGGASSRTGGDSSNEEVGA